jgi:hypothetical protein
MDASGIVEVLSRLQIVDGLYFKTSTDSEGYLERAFFVPSGALELYWIGAAEKHNVVLFDTKVRIFNFPRFSFMHACNFKMILKTDLTCPLEPVSSFSSIVLIRMVYSWDYLPR